MKKKAEGRCATNKSDTYGWAKPGDKGKQTSVSIDDLRVDHSYQRPEVSNPNTLAIAREFSWAAFGSIVVMQRAGNALYVVDGQQRLLAARRRGDITHVPCIVFQSDGRDHEAAAFIALNTRRSHVTSVVKYAASVSASIEPEKTIDVWLKSIGLKVSADGCDTKSISFPTVLISSWKMNDDICRKAIVTQQDVIGPDEPLNNLVHKGMHWLYNSGVDVSKYADKLKATGGRPAMLRAIRSVAIETGATSSLRVCGLGILSVINSKRRNKVIPNQ